MEENLRETLLKKYASGRSNLLLALILTLVNVVLILVGSDINFPFSISAPQIVAALTAVDGAEPNLVIPAAAIVILLALYAALYLLSAKRPWALTVAAVFLVLDTILLAVLFLSDLTSMLINVAFHVWVLYYLIAGVAAAAKLKKLPAEPAVDLAMPQDAPEFVSAQPELAVPAADAPGSVAVPEPGPAAESADETLP